MVPSIAGGAHRCDVHTGATPAQTGDAAADGGEKTSASLNTEALHNRAPRPHRRGVYSHQRRIMAER